MGGFKDDLDDLDDDVEIEESEDGDDEDYSFDDEDGDEDGEKSSKKNKSQSAGFDRESYYLYNKDKLVQLTGTIRPKERSKEGKVISLDFKTADRVYTVIMDTMGNKLLSSCFQELLVTGLVNKITDKEYTIAIKTYI